MNAERFTYLLKNPDQLTEVSYEELKHAVREYPFCQSLRLLLLQKSQLDQQEDLPDNIRLAAAYSNDRSHFYHFFKKGENRESPLNPYLMAENFLEQSQTRAIDLESVSEEIPTASAPPPPPKETFAFDLSDPNVEDITHEINFSNLSPMEDDDSMKFNLDEHLKNFREEQTEEKPLEEPGFKDTGEHVFFIEDLIETETDAATRKEESPQIEAEGLPEETLEKEGDDQRQGLDPGNRPWNQPHRRRPCRKARLPGRKPLRPISPSRSPISP